eukprot:g34085.t1
MCKFHTESVAQSYNSSRPEGVVICYVQSTDALQNCLSVSEPPLDLTDVAACTLAAADAIDQVDGCAGEPLSDVEDLLCALNG